MSRFLFLVLLVVLIITVCACRQNVPPANKPIPNLTTPTGEPGSLISEEAQLICAVETQEEAEEVAGLYGITLVDFRHGAAMYHTDEDPREVIRRGREKGWPELTLNYVRTPFSQP